MTSKRFHDRRRRPRKIITLATKMEVINRLDKGESCMHTCHALQLDYSNVYAIRHCAAKIKAKYAYTTAIESMEKMLSMWIKDRSERNIHSDFLTIKRTAQRFYADLRATSTMPIKHDFIANKEWFQDFLKRYNFVIKHQTECLNGNRPQRNTSLSSNLLPDLSADRMGMEESSTAVKGEGAPNYLTCSPVLATGPGLQEDHPSADPAPGPSSSSQETAEEKAPFTELDQEDLKPEETYTQPSEICEDENSQNIPQSTADRPPSRSSPASGMAGPYLLKKETHCATILDQLLRDDTFSDVILTAEGQSIRAHKIVLCLASAYFRRVLNKESSIQNVIVFRDIKFSELRNIINFIYTGEATVDAADLESFMRTAEMLEVNSLCEGQRNFPQNLFPRSKEVESEKPRISNVCSKRSHNNLSTSPPTKSRKIAAETPSMKLPRSSPCPSTSADNTAPSIRVSTSVIKSEPPDDEMTVEPEFRGKDYADAYVNPVDSPSNYEEPGESPPIRNEKPEKNPSSMCPFCLISPRAGTSLTNHVHLCHPDKPVFPCDNCSRVFFTKGSLEAHKDDCIR